MATPDIIVQVKGGKTSVITAPTGSATRLVELADVSTAALTDGKVLTYVAANGRYEFAVPTGAPAPDSYARPHSNGAFDHANAAFNQANTANVTGQAAFDKANGAIYTATQIRANISNVAPINYDTTNGIISHAVSGVTAAIYGNASIVPSVTVDSNGHVTSAVNTTIAIDASQITSNILSVVRGGTGQNTYSNGDLLIGNGLTGGLTRANLTQGYGILITNGNGSIRIESAFGKTYYFNITNVADVAGYHTAPTAPSPNPENTTVTLCTTANVFNLVGSFITDPGEPGTTLLPSGTYLRHLYATTDGASNIAKLRVELYKRAANGQETILRTNDSPNFSSADPEVVLLWTLTDSNGYALDPTDRMVFKLYAARISGGSGSVNVTIYYEGVNRASSTTTTILTPTGDTVARSHANGAFDKANTANVTGQAAFDKANGAIYTAAQIRANISNTAPINYDATTGIISHAASGVTASGYGNANTIPVVVVDAQGHLVSVTNTAIVFQGGSVTSPSITHSGDLDTGIFFPDADNVSVSLGGTEWLAMDMQLGSVVVGPLTVGADATFDGSGYRLGVRTSGSQDGILLNNPTSNANNQTVGIWFNIDNENDPNLNQSQPSIRSHKLNRPYVGGQSLTFATYAGGAADAANLAIRMTIDSGGAVGIGNTIPKHNVSISGNAWIRDTLFLQDGIHANGTLGNVGSILTSNGSGVRWSRATANGQLLIGNTVSGGYDANTITQGTGIAITNDKGSITIAATGTTINVGSIQLFSESVLANSAAFLRTDATNVSATTYATLFGVIDRSYGSGDGANTFTLPSVAPLVPMWVEGTAYTNPLQLASANTLSDGRVLVIAGHNASSGAVFANCVFGNVSGTTIVWTEGTAFPTQRFTHASVQLADGRVLVVAGRDQGGTVLDTTYFGNISGTTITWNAGTALPQSASAHTLNILADGRVLVTGGFSAGVGAVNANTYIGSIVGTTINWVQSTSLPEVKQYHNATTLVDGRVLVMGGTDAGGTILRTVHFGEVSGNTITWTLGSYLPVATAKFASVLMQHAAIMMVGGSGSSWNNVFVGSIYGRGISWTQVTSLPLRAQEQSMMRLSDGRILSLGGVDAISGATSNSTYFATPMPWGIKF